MPNSDRTTRFLFENTAIRGELTQLDDSLKEVLKKHPYPESIQVLIGQFMAAAAMLSDTLKFNGTLSLQVKGSGQVRTLMAECRNNRALRAIAQYNDDFSDSGELLGEGQLAITIEPEKGKRYQGIVPINDTEMTLPNVLESYFLQSEQIKTRIWLYSNDQRATGLLLQAMPQSDSISSLDFTDDDSWNRITHLASTLKDEEALTLDTETVLHRLFHEETVRVFEHSEHIFECSCNKQRCENAILTLGEAEAMSAVSQQGHIEIDCQFCHSRYAFAPSDVEKLFTRENK